jgi:hypothetical protein
VCKRFRLGSQRPEGKSRGLATGGQRPRSKSSKKSCVGRKNRVGGRTGTLEKTGSDADLPSSVQTSRREKAKIDMVRVFLEW